MQSKNIYKNPTFTHHQELKTICEPLGLLDITYFSHARVNNQGKFAAIGLCPDFFQLYMEKKYFNFDIHMAKLSPAEQYIIWDDVPIDRETQLLEQDYQDSGYGHTFTIIQNTETHRDCYHFGAKRGNATINQQYLQHLDLLKKFINYFTDKLKESRELNCFYDLTFTVNPDEGGFFTKQHLTTDMVAEFNQRVLTDRIHISKNSYITKRELECLYWLAQGKTLNEIASQLSIALRTAKAHIHNIKQKCSCDNQFQLGMLFERLRHIIE